MPTNSLPFLFLQNSAIVVTNCTFQGNNASDDGGGIFAEVGEIWHILISF